LPDEECPLRDGNPPDRDLAGSRIGLGVEGNLLALLQRRDARALQCGGVDEDVLAAVIRLDETEALVAVVELHCAVRHDMSFRLTVCTWDQARDLARLPRLVEFGESLKRAPAMRGEAAQLSGQMSIGSCNT